MDCFPWFPLYLFDSLFLVVSQLLFVFDLTNLCFLGESNLCKWSNRTYPYVFCFFVFDGELDKRMKFNPLLDHTKADSVEPKSLSLRELQLLLKIRRQDVELEWGNFKRELRFWERAFHLAKKSGLIEKVKDYLKIDPSTDASSQTNSEPGK